MGIGVPGRIGRAAVCIFLDAGVDLKSEDTFDYFRRGFVDFLGGLIGSRCG